MTVQAINSATPEPTTGTIVNNTAQDDTYGATMEKLQQLGVIRWHNEINQWVLVTHHADHILPEADYETAKTLKQLGVIYWDGQIGNWVFIAHHLLANGEVTDPLHSSLNLFMASYQNTAGSTNITGLASNGYIAPNNTVNAPTIALYPPPQNSYEEAIYILMILIMMDAFLGFQMQRNLYDREAAAIETETKAAIAEQEKARFTRLVGSMISGALGLISAIASVVSSYKSGKLATQAKIAQNKADNALDTVTNINVKVTNAVAAGGGASIPGQGLALPQAPGPQVAHPGRGPVGKNHLLPPDRGNISQRELNIYNYDPSLPNATTQWGFARSEYMARAQTLNTQSQSASATAQTIKIFTEQLQGITKGISDYIATGHDIAKAEYDLDAKLAEIALRRHNENYNFQIQAAIQTISNYLQLTQAEDKIRHAPLNV